MSVVKAAVAVAVSLMLICATTAVLFYVKLGGGGPQHPVFLYLLPIMLVAMLCGGVPATVAAVAAIVCAAFFLYDPVYSFYVSDQLEIGELVCFAILALIAVKCTVGLLRPVTKVPVPGSR